MIKIGERIRRARERAGLSQAELARRINVSRTAIYQWEEGQTTIRNGKVPALAAALGLQPNDLNPFDGDSTLARIEEKLDRIECRLERIERRLDAAGGGAPAKEAERRAHTKTLPKLG